MADVASLAVIGGSGLYEFEGLSNAREVTVHTPFGSTSAPVVLGELEGRQIAFLARHGVGHRLLPTEIPFRANIYALKTLGVERIVSISACGSLREELVPGHVVIPDQLLDFTKARSSSFFGDGLAAHLSTPDPFCPELSELLLSATQNAGGSVHKGGTFITVEGPRFSTRAESNLFRQWGMSVIGMTTAPEAFLAREAEICYAVMAHVTDYDVWHVTAEPVTVDIVLQTLAANTALAQQAVRQLAMALPDERGCTCDTALSGALITQRDAISPQARARLAPLIRKYVKT